MSIRPVDLQVLIPHATDVGKSQNAMDKSVITQQQQFGEQWKEISDRRQQKVQNATKAEGSKVRSDREKGQGNDASNNFMAKKKRAVKQDDGQLESSDPARGHLIDIKM